MITSLALLALTMGPPAALFVWLLSKCPRKTKEQWLYDAVHRRCGNDGILETPPPPPLSQAERVEYAKRIAARRKLQEEARRAREAAEREFQ